MQFTLLSSLFLLMSRSLLLGNSGLFLQLNVIGQSSLLFLISLLVVYLSHLLGSIRVADESIEAAHVFLENIFNGGQFVAIRRSGFGHFLDERNVAFLPLLRMSLEIERTVPHHLLERRGLSSITRLSSSHNLLGSLTHTLLSGLGLDFRLSLEKHIVFWRHVSLELSVHVVVKSVLIHLAGAQRASLQLNTLGEGLAE